jgi:two-component system LytT family sensor kinase
MDGSNKPRNPWLYIGGIWVCVALVQATQTVFGMRAAGMHHAWTKLFVFEFISWLPWMLATRAVIRLGRTFPLTRLSSWSLHLAAITLIGSLCAGWGTGLETVLAPWAPDELPGPFFSTWLQKSYGSYFVSLVIYALLLMVSFVVDSRQQLLRQQAETARLNEHLLVAQLNALRRQIDPHFIFNALNCIAGMMRERDNDGAVNMLVALSDVLRRLTRESSDTQVPLQREIEFLEKYLAIQKLRFADRLRVVMQVPEDLRRA